MSSTARTPNHDEGLSARSSITGQNEYLLSTNGSLNTSISGSGPGGSSVKITDGTNTANVGVGDTGFNGLIINGGVETLTFSTSVAGAQTVLANTDIRGYGWIEVVYTSVGTGLALTGQFSTASGGTYVNSNTFGASPNPPVSAIGTSVNTIYAGPTRGNFFQLAVSALTSGTFAGTVTLRAAPSSIGLVSSAQSGTWTVGANSATGSAVPANGFYQSGQARTTSPTAASTGNLVGFTSDIMGEQLVAIGGLVTTSVPANASNVVVKAGAGRLCNILVTTTGVTALQVYDNATTNTGTIIGQIPASAAVGSIYQFNMPAVAGITVAGSATNPAVTISWI